MKKQSKPIRVAVHRDGNGNKLIIDHYPFHANIKLKLDSENRSRNVGTVDFQERTFLVKRQRENHLFRKMNAYGLNHYVLKEAKLFDRVILKDEKQEWAIPREFILENGKFLNFSNHGGFELQIFIPLDKINQFEQKSSF